MEKHFHFKLNFSQSIDRNQSNLYLKVELSLLLKKTSDDRVRFDLDEAVNSKNSSKIQPSQLIQAFNAQIR